MKQMYYSEKLNKYYDDEKACVAAEKDFDAKQTEIVKAREERTKAADEVEAARKAYLQAYDHYVNLINDFIKKYKSYHYSYTTEVKRPDNILNTIFGNWPF